MVSVSKTFTLHALIVRTGFSMGNHNINGTHNMVGVSHFISMGVQKSRPEKTKNPESRLEDVAKVRPEMVKFRYIIFPLKFISLKIKMNESTLPALLYSSLRTAN